ncbi:MAG TPA: ubiquinol-cytochrome C chaperone family protein [Xanthobacteraceae bacterium]|nr:ubiquinol-cytochrome C chaperone family protein [Xanthobacteraceae bacterium]
MRNAYILREQGGKPQRVVAMFQRFRFREVPAANIRRLYGVIVAQARTPAFYADFGVPDTIEGRYDMVVLHVYLVFRRLAQAGEAARAAGQQMFDLFIEDMDASVRELGVGDLSVPRKVRAMAEAYFGRTQAYDAALAAAEDASLAAALTRNVYAGSGEGDALRLARYARLAEAQLAALDAGAIEEGNFTFPDPGEVRP